MTWEYSEHTLSCHPFRDFVLAFIHFKKPIVVAVNGPALGLGASILPLCDVVWASEKAWFQTPCAALHLTPSGCSSYTFPQILGVALVGQKKKSVFFCVLVPECHLIVLVIIWITHVYPNQGLEICVTLKNTSFFTAGQWDALLWTKTNSARSMQSRSGVTDLLASYI